MNCEEFRSQLEEGKHLAGTVAIEHLETCSECRSMAHADQELRQSLASVREAAPEISASLDRAVMAGYRRKRERTQSGSSRLRILKPLAWAAITAALIFAALLVAGHRKASVPTKPVEARVGPGSHVPSVEPVRKPEPGPGKIAEAPRRTLRRTPARRVKPSDDAPVTVAARSTPSGGFQNLMFCDPLSCPGAMQVIRIQVPASAMDRVPAWRPTGGMVQADVVVGSDGIARAIRIVR